ncbi:MAG: hypothetical protein R3F59_09255 [Myxococcota bacterium]
MSDRADITWVPEPDPSQSAVPGVPEGLLRRRYRLGGMLGRGGSGMVVRATDELTGDAVAVKFVPALHPAARRQLQRELAALLALRLPGVVRLRDEGVDGPLSFLVTDLVDGAPFGAHGPDWLASALALLDVVARVHLAGVLHLDLKPANVLVDAGGRPTLLDFGLARGRLVGGGAPGFIAGTPRYMAPEQRRGDPCDERTDLYAIACMITEAAGSVDALPPVWAAQVRRMGAPDPRDRTASALDVLAALDVDPLPQPARILGPPPWSEEQLRELFVDLPRSLLHLAEDAAALLVRSGGDVDAELRRWIRSGLASWSADGRVLVTRSALERIAASEGPEAKLVASLEGGAPVEEVVREALALARELVGAGAAERAAGLLEAAALWARGTAEERAVLEEQSIIGWELQNTAAVDRALHAVKCSSAGGDSTLETLLRGGRAALVGSAQHAVELLQPVEPLPPRLERWRHAMMLKAAHRLDLSTHARLLDEAKQALGSDEPKWTALLRYRQGDWTRAGELAERAGYVQLAAAAWLEAGELARARTSALHAVQVERQTRRAVAEAEARWVVRTIDYRSAAALSPEPERVAAAEAVGPGAAGLAALVEGAIAWRAGDGALGSSLAARAAAALEGINPPAALLAAGLCAALGSPLEPFEATSRRAAALADELAIQVLALLHRGGWRGARERLLRLLPEPPLDERRLDVISLAEARRWLDQFP